MSGKIECRTYNNSPMCTIREQSKKVLRIYQKLFVLHTGGLQTLKTQITRPLRTPRRTDWAPSLLMRASKSPSP
jgi:hypothetical protein